jgi:light-regulated signal transduction histidine kinase (bacteriophytochrome)
MAGLLGRHYDVAVVADGRAALEAVQARMPDLVVSDVMMPNLDGLGLVRELRTDPTTASLPVILLSARAGEDPSIEGLDAGADDYVAKPFSARELLARVRTHLDLAKARRRWGTELERANRELEAFSYSVSHDLRAPLRAISGFSEILLEDHGAQLDADSKDCVDEIQNAVRGMSELIEGLLELSQVSRAPLEVAHVDLSQLAGNVVAELRRDQPDREVTVHIVDGLSAEGDARLLQVVLVNLIGNAWKFTSRTDAARIEVGCKAGSEPIFFVRDNGAGFDATYSAKLFAPFQRLHSVSEFEGTGVGLSTVQRVIHRHGGRIWAEGAVGEGATFSFTLPSS